MLVTIRRALLSVSDKTGLVDFARALAARKVELLSTGGTARLLARSGHRGDRRRHVHRLSRDHGRARQDAASARAWRPAGPARHRRCRHGEARHPAHRPAGGEPLSIRRDRRQTRTAPTPKPSRTSTSAGPRWCAPRRRITNRSPSSSIRPTIARVLADLEANDGATSIDTRSALAAKAFAHTAKYDTMVSAYLLGS